MAKTVKIGTGKGNEPIKFHAGGLHETTNTPANQPIPESKLTAAAAGKYGKKGVQQANLARGLKKMRRG